MSPTVEIAAARNERSDSFVGARPVGSGGDWLGGARGGVVVTVGAAVDVVVVVGAAGGAAGDGAIVVGGAVIEVVVVTGGSLDVDCGEVVVGGGGAGLVVGVGVPQSGSLSGLRALPLRPGAGSNPERTVCASSGQYDDVLCTAFCALPNEQAHRGAR